MDKVKVSPQRAAAGAAPDEAGDSRLGRQPRTARPTARTSRSGTACRSRRARNTASSCFIPTTTNCTSAPETASSCWRATSDRPPTAAWNGRPSAISVTVSTPIRSCSTSRSEKGFAIRTEPHPRFYTDRTDTVPIAVPALVRNWWPMMFFTVFKSPAEGRTHIFRPERAVRPDHRDPGRGQLRTGDDERRGSRRARTAGPAHLRQPAQTGRRDRMDVDDRHGVRRHLSAHLHRAAKEKSRRSG